MSLLIVQGRGGTREEGQEKDQGEPLSLIFPLVPHDGTHAPTLTIPPSHFIFSFPEVTQMEEPQVRSTKPHNH